MTEHITRNYQGMVQRAGQPDEGEAGAVAGYGAGSATAQAYGGDAGATGLGGSVGGAESPTASELQPMRSGERWSLTATERAYNAGGNEPGTMTSGSPQQEQQ